LTLLDSPDTDTAESIAEHDDHSLEPVSLVTRISYLAGILLPFGGFIAAAVHLWGWGFDWVHLGLFLGMYLISAVGVTIGYHRLFCHRAFQAPRFVQFILSVFGSMALEGPVLKWVAMHRCHHQHSDAEGDPHSPHLHGSGAWGALKGMWHAHVGWIFQGDPKNLFRYVPDLARDPMLRWTSRFWMSWAVLGGLVPAILGGLLTMSWTGALLGFVWGGLARVFIVHHVTWSVNSICHIWGTRPFRSNDESRNNFIVGVIALGEGWHNNHHAFPASARHGLRWWEIDVSYWIIRAMALVGLAWDLNVPGAARLAAKRAS
jgi:stearoyl-CoA desaturase (delta-9 desaturase)